MNARVEEVRYALGYFRNTHNPCTGEHCFNCRRIAELQDELLVIAATAATEAVK